MGTTSITVDPSPQTLEVVSQVIHVDLALPLPPLIEFEHCLGVQELSTSKNNFDVVPNSVSFDLIVDPGSMGFEAPKPVQIGFDNALVELLEICEPGPAGPPGDSIQRSALLTPGQSQIVDSVTGVLGVTWFVHLTQGGSKRYLEVFAYDGTDYFVPAFSGDPIAMTFNVVNYQLFFENTSLTENLAINASRLTVKGV